MSWNKVVVESFSVWRERKVKVKNFENIEGKLVSLRMDMSEICKKYYRGVGIQVESLELRHGKII